MMLLLACAPEPEYPPGWVVAGTGDSAAKLAACLATFPDSPAARWSAELASRVSTCPTFRAVSPEVASLPAAAACGEPLGPELTLVTPDRSVATVTLSDRVTVEAELRGVPDLLRPGPDPGPAVLRTDSIAHVRIDVEGGIDLSGATGQGEDMFGLTLFGSTVLDGTWEVAAYAPFPRFAAAVGVRSRAAADAAMTSYLDRVRQSWDVQVVPARFGEADGACMPGLNLLPGLAPCYVATDGALVLGWDRASLEHAVGSGERVAVNGLVIDGDRMGEADGGAYPWGRIEVTGTTEGDTVRLRGSSTRSCP